MAFRCNELLNPDGPARVDHAITTLSTHLRLTRSERFLLRAAVSGSSRPDIARQRGVSENTVKTQVRSLLRKTRCNNLEQLRAMVLELALTGVAEL